MSAHQCTKMEAPNPDCLLNVRTQLCLEKHRGVGTEEYTPGFEFQPRCFVAMSLQGVIHPESLFPGK